MNVPAGGSSERLIAEDGELDRVEGFLSGSESAELRARLLGELAWHGEEIAIFGRAGGGTPLALLVWRSRRSLPLFRRVA
ncbi:MAG: hypothetical protein PHT19_12395 [Methylococcus sp.]|nr:hypothetical protein [Methylococcus sp.]